MWHPGNWVIPLQSVHRTWETAMELDRISCMEREICVEHRERRHSACSFGLLGYLTTASVSWYMIIIQKSKNQVFSNLNPKWCSCISSGRTLVCCFGFLFCVLNSHCRWLRVEYTHNLNHIFHYFFFKYLSWNLFCIMSFTLPDDYMYLSEHSHLINVEEGASPGLHGIFWFAFRITTHPILPASWVIIWVPLNQSLLFHVCF